MSSMVMEPRQPSTSWRAFSLGLAGAIGCGAVAATASVWAVQAFAALEATTSWDRTGQVSDVVLTVTAGVTAIVAAWLAVLLAGGAVAVVPGTSAAPLRTCLRARWGAAAKVAAMLVMVTTASALPASARLLDGPLMDGPAAAAAAQLASAPHHATGGDAPAARGQERYSPDGVRREPPRLPQVPPDEAEPRPAQHEQSTPDQALPEPGWQPTGQPSPPAAPAPATDGSAVAARVVVRAGDTLWDIAARRLGAGASESAIAAEWPRWYAANRAVIGPDPDLILPGQELRAPGSSGASGAECDR